MKISQIYKTLIKKELEDFNIIQQKDNNENNHNNIQIINTLLSFFLGNNTLIILIKILDSFQNPCVTREFC